MDENHWFPESLENAMPVYLAIVEALENDILSGRLKAGQKLPPQRQLAAKLNVNLTTISRAYKQAQKRELIDSRVGQGSFIRIHDVHNDGRENPFKRPAIKEIDMGMNIPPIPNDQKLITRMKREMAEAVRNIATQSIFGYHDFIGSLDERTHAARWLSKRYSLAHADTLMIAPGTQSLLLALLPHLIKPGKTICCEHLTYPGFKSLCQRFNISVRGLQLDEDGICPQDFERACEQGDVRALYCTPTMHNPTSLTWSVPRRKKIAEIARQYDVSIIEDDPYGMLPTSSAAPLSSYAPERSFYIFGLSKCLSSALRVAFLCVPNQETFAPLSMALRSTAMMVSPMARAMALHLINSGLADNMVNAIRTEAQARQMILKSILPEHCYTSDPDGFHVWLKLPDHIHIHHFIGELRSRSIKVVPAEIFSVLEDSPNAVRVCLGVAESATQCRFALQTIHDVMTLHTNDEQAFV